METIAFAILGFICIAAGGVLINAEIRFRQGATVVVGTSVGERQDAFRSYRLIVRYRCPHTKQQRKVVGLAGREDPRRDDGTPTPVKVHVSNSPPHRARFDNAPFLFGIGLIAFGLVWVGAAVSSV